MKVLPETASILFGSGFLRSDSPAAKRAAQRAIYYVQHELEEAADADGTPAVVLCDRGTVDGIAYWLGPQGLWSAVGTTQQAELARYDAVIHLRTPGPTSGYDHSNPCLWRVPHRLWRSTSRSPPPGSVTRTASSSRARPTSSKGPPSSPRAPRRVTSMLQATCRSLVRWAPARVIDVVFEFRKESGDGRNSLRTPNRRADQYQTAIERATAALKAEGLGVLTTIDV